MNDSCCHGWNLARASAWAVLFCQLSLALAGAGAAALPPAALANLQTNSLLRHIQRLSSDEFEGRAPASRGEDLTVNYLVEQFRQLGLKPGNPQAPLDAAQGGYVQSVPLMGVTSEASMRLELGGQTLSLAMPSEAIAASMRFEPRVRIAESEVVFVGYGVVAPEYHWDDYKDVDVRGKTLVMLVNDPPVPSPTDASKLDETMFQGRAMTYYGRWTYKYEIAAEKGAAAALVVHETGPAGYPYFVLVASHARENFDLQSTHQNRERVAVQGWLTQGKAEELFRRSGREFQQMKQAALQRDFKPISLGAKASFDITNHLRPVISRNVVARLDGADPAVRNEYVVYTAHWDHIGRNDKLQDDQIFNGALDNAAGTAGLLELGKAFARLERPPRRSVVFLAVTAEEKGLLGAKYYVEHPLYPLARTLANLNMDGLNPWGQTRDVEVVGFGNSDLEELLARAATREGRVITTDSSPEKGRYFRSDHFEFAKVGVPALYLKGGVDFVGRPPGYGKQKLDEYTDRDYHKVSDEIKADWDLTGAVTDLQLLMEVGWETAEAKIWPAWKAGSEFKARREKMLQEAGVPSRSTSPKP